jgi:hypothetical protein
VDEKDGKEVFCTRLEKRPGDLLVTAVPGGPSNTHKHHSRQG